MDIFKINPLKTDCPNLTWNLKLTAAIVRLNLKWFFFFTSPKKARTFQLFQFHSFIPCLRISLSFIKQSSFLHFNGHCLENNSHLSIKFTAIVVVGLLNDPQSIGSKIQSCKIVEEITNLCMLIALIDAAGRAF